MARKSSARKKTEDELMSLIPQLDDEGLAFLLRQAKIHLHNMEVDRINAEIEKAAASAADGRSSARRSGGGRGKGSGQSTGVQSASRSAKKNEFSIKHSAGAGCYHLRFNGDWKLVTEAEMLALVRIAKSRQPVADRDRQFFAWLKKERSDILVEFGISSFSDATLKEFIAFLKKTFAIRKKKNASA